VNYTVVQDSPAYEYFLNMAGAENELYNKWKVLPIFLNSEKCIFPHLAGAENELYNNWKVSFFEL
jgi:hypothetical protein